MCSFKDEDLIATLEKDTGKSSLKPAKFHSFPDPPADVKRQAQVKKNRASPDPTPPKKAFNSPPLISSPNLFLIETEAKIFMRENFLS